MYAPSQKCQYVIQISNSLCLYIMVTSIPLLPPGESVPDLLDLMLQSRDINSSSDSSTPGSSAESNGSRLTDNDITDDIILFLIAGHDTVTNSLTWLLLELATNPHIQERCRAEVQQVMQDSQDLTSDICSR